MNVKDKEGIRMTEPQFRKFLLGDLNPAQYNPRIISDEAMEGLRNSLARFGCVEPIIVNVRDDKTVIVGGHQRHKALVNLHGEDYECTCIVVDLNEADEKLLNLALNNPLIQGEFISGLNDYIEAIKTEFPENQSDLLDLRINELMEEVGICEQGPDESPEIAFTQEVREENNYLVFVFDDVLDWQVVKDLFELKTVQALDSKPGYEKKGVGRVLSGKMLLERCNA